MHILPFFDILRARCKTRLQTVENPSVGADAFIGPLEKVANSPETSRNCGVLLQGRCGHRPLRIHILPFSTFSGRVARRALNYVWKVICGYRIQTALQIIGNL